MEKQMKKPQLRFPEFKGDWEKKKLGEVAEITTGSTPSTAIEEYYNGDKLFVSPADLQGNRYIENTKTTLTELGFSKGRKLKKGSVLFVCIGSTIGKVGLANEECLSNQQINALYAKENFENDFIYTLLEKNGSEIKLLAGVQAVPQINKTDFSNLSFSFPTLPEQTKIAAFLTAVDEKLQALKKKKTLLEQYKKGVMQKLFSSELGLIGLEDEQDCDEKNPKILKSSKSRFRQKDGSNFPNWEVKKLGEVLETIATKKYQIKSTEFKENGKYSVIDQGKDIIAGYSYSENNVFRNLPVIVFGDHTTILKFIDFDFVVGADGTKLLKSKGSNDLKYLYYNLEFNNVKQEGYKRHFTMLSEVYLQIPSIKEQTLIANFLSSIDKKINHTQTLIEKTEIWKKGLLQKMFV